MADDPSSAAGKRPNSRGRRSEPETIEQSLIGYFCGQWIPADQMLLPLDDAGFRQGVTAVERLRTHGGKLKFASRHFQRWQQTTDTLSIENLPSASELLGLLDEILARNHDAIKNLGDVGLTIVATPGSRRNSPTLAIRIVLIDHAKVDRFRNSGQPIVITEVVQPPRESWSRQIKVRSRIHYYLADRAAREKHSEAVGILTNTDGTITEASTCNLAIVQAGAIISPPAESVLGGITQSVVEEIASSQSITWTKRPLSRRDLRTADEVLMMGTTTGLWFASAVDEVVFKHKTRPIYSQLLSEFQGILLAGDPS